VVASAALPPPRIAPRRPWRVALQPARCFSSIGGGPARMDSLYDLDNVEEFGGFARRVERSIVPRQLFPSKKTFHGKA
jgi:hypothetical protein